MRVSADAAELPSVDALQPLMRGAGIEVRSWLRSSPAEDDTTRADLEIAPLIGEAPQNEKSAFMARLFTEELHVLARSDIKTLSDLRGRRVSLGVVGSPERNAAVKIFDAEHVDVVETPLDLDNAIDALSLNAIDAVAIIAPKPFARLQDIKDADFHLLAVPPPSHMEGLWPSAFDHADYPALVDARIDAVALNAGLFNKAPVDHGKSAATKQFFAALVSHGAQLASLSPTWSEVKIQDGGRRADGQAGSQK